MYLKNTKLYPTTPSWSNINIPGKKIIIISYKTPYNQLLDNMENLGVSFTISDFTDFFNMLIINHICDNSNKYTWSVLWETFESMLDAMEHDGSGHRIQYLINDIEAITKMHFPHLREFNRHNYIVDAEPIGPALVMINYNTG